MFNLIEVLKALADETRFTLLQLLLEHDYCVRALANRLKISPSAVSQHLKVLRGAGIVKGDKRGYFTHYYVNRELLLETAKKVKELSEIVPQETLYSKTQAPDNTCCCNNRSKKEDLL